MWEWIVLALIVGGIAYYFGPMIKASWGKGDSIKSKTGAKKKKLP